MRKRRKSFKEIITSIMVFFIVLVSSSQMCYADVDIEGLEGVLNGLITQQQVNQSNNPKVADRNNVSEIIDPMTGSLIIKHTDLSLPGKDGLDLSLARIYNSSLAEMGTKKVKVTSSSDSWTTSSSTGWIVEVHKCDSNGNWSTFYRGPYSDEFDAWMEYFEYYLDDTPNVLYVPQYPFYGRIITYHSSYTVTTYNYPDKYSYLRSRYDLGTGWAFAFPSVQIVQESGNDYLYYHDGTGGAYRVIFTSDTADSNLENYQGKDVTFLEDSGSYVNEDNIASSYKFVSSDKRESYFAEDGRLIGIKDRFGNEIKFRHINRSIHGVSYPFICEITDSVGRTIDFQYENTINDTNFNGERISVTVNHPQSTNSLTLVYNKWRDQVANISTGETYYEPYLWSVTDPEERVIYYSDYNNHESLKFLYQSKNLSSYALIPIELIGSVTYSNSKTTYSYDKITRNLGPNGAAEAYRVNARYDQEWRKDYSTGQYAWNGELNHIDYTYGGDCTGYPNYRSEDDMPETYEFWMQAQTTDGLSTKTVYNGKKKQVRTENTAANGEKNIVKNLLFDSNYIFKPTKTEIAEYASDGTAARQLYVEKTYTDWGGLIGVTKPLTSTQLSDTAFKQKYTTTYSYNDPNYKCFTTGKSWYQNENTQLSDSITYDALGRINSVTNEKGEITNYSYYTTAEGENVEITKALGNGKTAKTINVYGDAANNAYITCVKDYYTDSQGVYTETRTDRTYDMLLGLVKTETNNEGRTTSYEYDNLGRVTLINMPNYTDRYGSIYYVKSLFTYYNGYAYFGNDVDLENRDLSGTMVLSRTHYTTDPNSNYGYYDKWQRYYDGFGNLRIEEFSEYDDEGWIIKSQYLVDEYQRPEAYIDAEGNREQYYYDDWGRHSETVDSYGNLYKSEYDVSSQKTSNYFVAQNNVYAFRANPAYDLYKENMVETYLDQWNRVHQKKAYPDWPQRTNELYESYNYDFAGNIVSYTDPKGNTNESGSTKTFSYDSLNRVIQIKDALNQLTEVDYTVLGNIKSIKMRENSAAPAKTLYTKQYDELGHITSKTDPSSNSSTYKYDELGLAGEITDRNGNLSTLTYDEHNRIMYDRVQLAGSTDSMEYKYHYSNPLGVAKVQDYKNDVSEGYTERQFTSTGLIDDKLVRYSSDNYQSVLSGKYDNNDRTKSISIWAYDFNPFYTNYTYDGVRLDKVQTNGAGPVDTSAQACADYDYYADGKLKKITYPQLNGGSYLTTEYTYDKLNRLYTITNKKGSTILSSYQYSYDRNGNIESIQDKDGNINTYVYDKLNRLEEVHCPDRTIIYSYDFLGNRKTMQNTSLVMDLTDTSYTYNARDQLESVSKEGAITAIKYQSDGLRYKKSTGTEGVQYHYNLKGKVIAESNLSGTVTANYVWGPDRALVKKDSSGGEYYYLYNGHGDVIQVVDRDGNIVNNYQYDEWGNILNQSETIDNPFKFAGEILDQETGLYYLRARYYDPTVGRFINEDSFEGTVTNPLTLNVYTYCYNNPLAYIDPSGHMGIGQVDNLLGGLIMGATGIADLIDMFNIEMFQALWEFGKAIANGQVSFTDVAKTVGASFTEPFRYLAENSQQVWQGNPTDQGVYEYGKQMGNVVQMVIGVVGGGGVVGAKLVQTLGKIAPKLAKVIDKAVDVSRAVGGKGAGKAADNVVDKASDLHRPYIRKSVRTEVEARAPKTADGRFIDPNTRLPIDGKYDLGHKPGYEFWREKANAQNEGLIQKQFNDRMNNPDYYQIEDPLSNRSHRYEMH